MKKRSGSYPPVRVEGNGRTVVSQAGAVLLVETARKSGVDAALSVALAPWCKPRAVHDPGKILLDLVPATALGGDCLADVAMLRADAALFGPVASDPTVSRLVDTLAAAGSRALAAIRSAQAEVSDRIWQLAGPDAPHADGQVIVDIDGVLVLAHSDKEDATRTWKKTYAWMPMLALTGPARLWEPKRLRLRLFSAAAQLVTTGRRRTLRLAGHWPWTDVITRAVQRLSILPNPG
ncbi:transposase [Kitasatospora sp. NPDC094011]|uniref:transposase n=1 Tax=Kitasatospora sp. NPDC094011 TaxID=3364090 RepID=UPI00380D3F7D